MHKRIHAVLATTFGLLAAACGGDTAGVQDSGASQDAAIDVGSTADAAVPDDSGTPETGTPDAGTPDSGPDSSSFSVKNVPGLVLWLDGSQGVTSDVNGSVSKWADQSGNANDAVQLTAGLRPTLVAQSINGKPAIHFTTNASNTPFPHLTVPDATTLRLGTGDFYITCVVKWSNANSGPLGAVFTKQDVAGPFAGYALYMNYPTAGHAGGQLDQNTNIGSTAAALNDGLPRQYGLARFSNTASVRVSGASSGTLPNTNVTADAVGVPLSIGGRAPDGLHPLLGDVAELIVVKGAISGSNLTAIEAYLQSKYAL